MELRKQNKNLFSIFFVFNVSLYGKKRQKDEKNIWHHEWFLTG